MVDRDDVCSSRSIVPSGIKLVTELENMRKRKGKYEPHYMVLVTLSSGLPHHIIYPTSFSIVLLWSHRSPGTEIEVVS